MTWDLNESDIEKARIFALPTDTVYGLHARALNKSDVEALRKLKGRDKDKPFIVLVSSLDELENFTGKLSHRLKSFLQKVWPGPVSVLLKVNPGFEHISQSGKIAFRMPNKSELLDLLKITGPLVSSSANLSGKETLKNAKEIKDTFDDKVDLYVDEGELRGEPSLLLDLLR